MEIQTSLEAGLITRVLAERIRNAKFDISPALTAASSKLILSIYSILNYIALPIVSFNLIHFDFQARLLAARIYRRLFVQRPYLVCLFTARY